MRRSHLLPPALLLAAALSAAPVRAARPLRVALAGYLAALVAETVRLGARSGRPRDAAFLPAIVVTMHVAWGSGFLTGSMRFGPPFRAVACAMRPRRHTVGWTGTRGTR